MIGVKNHFTLGRYLYLNFWGLLLISISLIFLITLVLIDYSYFIAIPIIFILICLYGGFSILKTWNDKKRKYQILITKNEKNFYPESFKEYMQAPCGRLLVRIVLKDLNKLDQYKDLNKYRGSFLSQIKQIRKGCMRSKTVIRYYPPQS